MIEDICIVCSETNFSTWAISHDIQNFTTVKCNACGFIWTNPRPSDEDIDEYYDNYAKLRSALDKSVTDNRKIQYEIDRDFAYGFFEDEKEICTLDFGCYDGSFLSIFDNRFKKHGIDKSKDAIEWAKNNLEFGNNMHCCKIVEAPYRDEYFDFIILRGVIEHLPHPNRDIRKVVQLLRPGGLLYLCATPNVDSFSAKKFKNRWNQFKPPEHLLYFSDYTLERYLGLFGMTMLAKYFPYVETPYANTKKDYTNIKEAYSNGNETVCTPFYNNMMNVMFIK